MVAATKMKKPVTSHRSTTLRDVSFEKLIATVPELAEARREYASQSPEKRRAATSWAYDSGMANDLFSRALLSAGGDADFDSGFESGVEALAIAPLFDPA